MSTPISQHASSQPRQRQQPPNELAGFEAARPVKTARQQPQHPGEAGNDPWATAGAAAGTGGQPPF